MYPYSSSQCKARRAVLEWMLQYSAMRSTEYQHSPTLFFLLTRKQYTAKSLGFISSSKIQFGRRKKLPFCLFIKSPPHLPLHTFLTFWAKLFLKTPSLYSREKGKKWGCFNFIYKIFTYASIYLAVKQIPLSQIFYHKKDNKFFNIACIFWRYILSLHHQSAQTICSG